MGEIVWAGLNPAPQTPLNVEIGPHRRYAVVRHQLEDYKNLDGLIVAVSHKEYIQLGQSKLLGMVRDNGCFIDVKSVFSPTKLERGIQYWSL